MPRCNHRLGKVAVFTVGCFIFMSCVPLYTARVIPAGSYRVSTVTGLGASIRLRKLTCDFKQKVARITHDQEYTLLKTASYQGGDNLIGTGWV